MASGAARITRTRRLLASWWRLYGLTSGSLAANPSHARCKLSRHAQLHPPECDEPLAGSSIFSTTQRAPVMD